MQNNSFIVFLVISSLVLSLFSIHSNEQINVLSRSIKLMKEQEQAVEAYDTLLKSFNKADENVVLFPDDYCGAWIDGRNLVIAVTPTSDIDVYKKTLASYDCIRFSYLKYPLNFLERIKNRIVEKTENFKPQVVITSSFSDIMHNRVMVEIQDYKPDNDDLLIAQLSKIIGITDDEVLSLITFSQGDYVELEASLRGGSGIVADLDTSTADGTLGMCGTITVNGSSYPGLITCGHLVPPSLSDYNKDVYFSGGGIIGRMVKRQFANNQYGDYGVVKKASNSGHSLTSTVFSQNGSISITGTFAHLPINATFMKYGAASGYLYGTITAWNASSTASYGGVDYVILGVSRGTISYGASSAGDSGGPYYCSSPSGYKFVGVHHGKYKVNGVMQVFFTPYERFQSYFTPYTS